MADSQPDSAASSPDDIPREVPDSKEGIKYPSSLTNRSGNGNTVAGPGSDRLPTPTSFHTFKVIPMAPTSTSTSTITPSPTTPANGTVNAHNVQTNMQAQNQHQNHQNHQNQNHDANSSTPTSESRMNPPPRPPMTTPVREVREGSQLSTSGGSARKPRQNLDERDHISMLKACYDEKHNFKEGTKAQFWTGVNEAFRNDTGKVLAQMSATVGRLVEVRRRAVSDWENGVIPNKPGGELNDRLDQWIEFLKVEDADAESERMRQVDARRKVEEARKESRRQAIAAESLAQAQNPGVRIVTGPAPPAPIQQGPPNPSSQHQAPPPQSKPPPEHQHPSHHHQRQQQHPMTHQPPPPIQQAPSPHGGAMVPHQQPNGQSDMNGYRPAKRRRGNERAHTQELQQQLQHEQWQQTQQNQQVQQYPVAPPPVAQAPAPPKRVVVEGAMTKEDWREVMGNDARLRTLETKVDRIEVLLNQNNKLLLQLVQNQNATKERDRHHEEERVPVHLDAEFERDYL